MESHGSTTATRAAIDGNAALAAAPPLRFVPHSVEPAIPPAAATTASADPVSATSAEGLVTGTAQHTVQENSLVVAEVARKHGIDPVLAVATMLYESGGDNREKTGDDGTSFGLFQLHEGGHIPASYNRGGPDHEKVFDPWVNAEFALAEFALNKDTFSGAELAFKSQRPANHDSYVAGVNGQMEAARMLLGA